MRMKALLNDPNQFAAMYNQAMAELQREFGNEVVSGFQSGLNGTLYMYRAEIPELKSGQWTTQAHIALSWERGISGYVYPVYQGQWGVYHNNANNATPVLVAKPPWEELHVALSDLIVRLKRVFKDGHFTYMDNPQ